MNGFHRPFDGIIRHIHFAKTFSVKSVKSGATLSTFRKNIALIETTFFTVCGNEGDAL